MGKDCENNGSSLRQFPQGLSLYAEKDFIGSVFRTEFGIQPFARKAHRLEKTFIVIQSPVDQAYQLLRILAGEESIHGIIDLLPVARDLSSKGM